MDYITKFKNYCTSLFFSSNESEGSLAELEAGGYTTKTATGEYGLLTVCNPENANIDICFVHGLTGNFKTTWTYKKGGNFKKPWADTEDDVFWPEKLLPLDLPRARILSFGYNAAFVDVVEQSNTLRDHGNKLATDLSNMRELDDTNNRPIIFVVHSLGGLVIEQALLLCTTNMHDLEKFGSLLKNTYGITFMGTPHAGADKERFAQILRKFATVLGYDTNPAILGALNPTSEVLAYIEQEFQKHLRFRKDKLHLPEMKIFNFYETLPVDLMVWGFKVTDVGIIVPKTSAILDAFLWDKIEANHIDMTKFSSRNGAYKSVVSLMQIWAKHAVAGVQQNQDDLNKEVRERRIERLAPSNQTNIHTLAGPSATAERVRAGGNVNQRVQAAGGNIVN